MLQRMKAEGVKPDFVAYTVIINELAKEDRFGKVRSPLSSGCSDDTSRTHAPFFPRLVSFCRR